MQEIKKLVESYEAARTKKEELENALKEANRELVEAEAALSDEMLESDVPSITVGGYTYNFKNETKYSFKSAEKLAEMGADKFQVLRDNGFDFLIVEQVNARSLSSAMKDAEVNLDGGIPDDVMAILNAFEVQGVNRRKATAKAMAKVKEV